MSRQHYGRIKDELAKQCNKEGKNIFIRLEKGYFVIDNSFNLNEAETQGEKAISYMDDNYTPFIRSLMDVPFTTYDFKEQHKIMNNLLGNQQKYMENIDLHLSTLKDIKDNIKKNNIIMENLGKTIIKRLFERQKKLGEF